MEKWVCSKFKFSSLLRIFFCSKMFLKNDKQTYQRDVFDWSGNILPRWHTFDSLKTISDSTLRSGSPGWTVSCPLGALRHDSKSLSLVVVLFKRANDSGICGISWTYLSLESFCLHLSTWRTDYTVSEQMSLTAQLVCENHQKETFNLSPWWMLNIKIFSIINHPDLTRWALLLGFHQLF